MNEEIRIGARHDADCCCEQCVCEKEQQREVISKVARAALSKRQLASGAPVPEDNSHTELKANGQQREYIVLTEAERAKGFVKPLRYSYVHAFPSERDRQVGCGVETTMGSAIAETYARDPAFYSGTYCVGCRIHRPLKEFIWCGGGELEGEPMDPARQEDWLVEKRARHVRELRERRLQKITDLQAELTRVQGEHIAVWRGDYIAAIRKHSGMSDAEATAVFEAGASDHDLTEDPEQAALDEMSYWDDDGSPNPCA